VFKLRKGVKWQAKPPVNGRELTADDVVFSVNHFLTVKGNANAYMLKSVDKVEAVDKYTVKFTLKEPFVWFLDMLSNPTRSPSSPGKSSRSTAISRSGNPSSAPAHGCSTRIARTSGLTYVRNPNYFIQGLPYIDRIEATVDEDNASRMAAFLSGKYDLGWEFPGTINRVDWVQIKDTLKQKRRGSRPSSTRRR